MNWNKIALGLLLSLPISAPAEEIDPSVIDAILGTQKALQDPKERAKIADTPQAKASLEEVKMLGGKAENAEALFALSAEIFEELAKKTKGDPAKMDEILQKARANPSEFANTFSPALKAKLSELAKRIPEPPKKLH